LLKIIIKLELDLIIISVTTLASNYTFAKACNGAAVLARSTLSQA
jgi:hypothetical protein